MDIDLRFDDARIEGTGLVATDDALREALRVEGVHPNAKDPAMRHALTDGVVIFHLETGTLTRAGKLVCAMEPGDYVITRFGLARFVDTPHS